ncbi:MAG: hypothetical protein JXB88_04015 [Spirochaetales bacterium]|nr:hypothetical protein [Spirochaetales bacterium]
MDIETRKVWTEEEVFEQIKKILKTVAPTKILGEIEMDHSIVEDYSFDSIDIIDTMLKIQEVFLGTDAEPINYEGFLNEAYANYSGKMMSVNTICQLISEYLKVTGK